MSVEFEFPHIRKTDLVIGQKERITLFSAPARYIPLPGPEDDSSLWLSAELRTLIVQDSMGDVCCAAKISRIIVTVDSWLNTSNTNGAMSR